MMKIFRLFFAFFFLIAFYGADAQVQSEWRGVGRTGVYEKESNLLKEWPVDGPNLLWYADSLPKGYASVAVANNKVYVTGIVDTMDVLVAYSLQGKKLWQTPFGRAWDNSFEHSRCTPTIENNRVYLSSGLGDVSCINAESGKVIWLENVAESLQGSAGKFGYSESVLIFEDLVFFTTGGDNTTMVALNKSNGQLVWKTESLNNSASYASPLHVNHNGNDLIINFTENYLFAINPMDGKLLWKFDFGEYAGGKSKRNNQTNTPLYNNGELFLSSGYDHKSVMLSLADDASSVDVKYVDTILDVHHGGVVSIDGFIYGANWIHNRMGNWTCIEWETGELKYSEPWGNKGSIIAADGMLYCYEEKKGTVGIAPVNPEKFEIISSFKVPYGTSPYWAHLVIDNGLLMVRSATAIMIYDIRNKN